MWRLGFNTALGLIALGLSLPAIDAILRVSRLAHTCVVCRLGRVDDEFLGRKRSTFTENDCSRWYASHVEPRHEHIWDRGTCRFFSGPFGLYARVSCLTDRFPIWLLDPTTQREAYQHFRDPMEAKRLFAGLTDAKTHDDRLENDHENRGDLTARAIQEWKSAGFPGQWKDWWARFSAKHAEEHQKRLSRLQAGGRRNLRDWQAKKKSSN